jgi:hypothetical protein
MIGNNAVADMWTMRQRSCAQRDRTLSRFQGFAPCLVASDAENTLNHPKTLVHWQGTVVTVPKSTIVSLLVAGHSTITSTL